MEKIKFELEHCYGINKADFELDFTNSNTNIIYASNGTMKTSFADTMNSMSNGETPKDRIEDIEGKANILVDGIRPIEKDEILVIEAEYISDDMEENTSLLASKKLKQEYDNIYSSINKKMDVLMKKIKKVSGCSQDEFFEISKDLFVGDPRNLLDVFEYIYKNMEIENYTDEELQNIKYKEIFNKDTEKLFTDQDFLDLINEYMEIYNKIFANSEIFVRGKFNHYNAQVISKNLEDNGYFIAGHRIRLKNSTGEIAGSDELNKIIEDEKDKELQNTELKEHFNKIDEKLRSPVGVRKLKEYLLNNRELLHYIVDIEELKRRLLLNYILLNNDEFKSLMSEYESSKEKIKEILDKAKDETTTWQKVKDLFKSRFFVPFDIEVKNKEDVILKEQRLSIEYKFGKKENEVSKDNLMKCLSKGEKRAYYMLNMLYQLEKAKSIRKDILIILDDLADSFDYRNKYAIIEYLCDLKNIQNFKILILTHNFDFYRTVSNRLNLKGKQAYFAVRNDKQIVIQRGEYFGDIFLKWKKDIYNNKKIFISAIPFIRNISEYLNGGKGNEVYEQLTNVLHMKQTYNIIEINDVTKTIKKTKDIHVSDIKEIFKKVWNIDTSKDSYDDNEPIFDFIMQVADEIEENTSDSDILLENKIVLSMAIRLKAELYMIERINNDEMVKSIEENQTRQLFEKVVWTNVEDDIKTKNLLNEVLLMTSENIHLNSFMYEPIIDMSIEHLKRLYKEISEINEKKHNVQDKIPSLSY